MTEQWELKAARLPHIATPRFEHLRAAALEAGAGGVTMMGAGGGGFLLAYAPDPEPSRRDGGGRAPGADLRRGRRRRHRRNRLARMGGSRTWTEHRLLDLGPSAGRSRGGRRGRQARLPLDLDRRGLWLRCAHPAGMVGRGDRERPAGHGDHADVRAHAGRRRDGGDDDGPPLRRALHPRPRRVGPAGGGGLVRPAVRQAAGAHTRVRGDRARHRGPRRPRHRPARTIRCPTRTARGWGSR